MTDDNSYRLRPGYRPSLQRIILHHRLHRLYLTLESLTNLITDHTAERRLHPHEFINLNKKLELCVVACSVCLFCNRPGVIASRIMTVVERFQDGKAKV